MKLEVKSLEKQIKAKLAQKIKSNAQLKEKMQLLKDINEQKRQVFSLLNYRYMKIVKSLVNIRRKISNSFMNATWID